MVDTTATLATDSPAVGATAGWSVWKTSEKLTIIMICNCNAIYTCGLYTFFYLSLQIILYSRMSKFCVDALDTAGWSVCGIPHRNQL